MGARPGSRHGTARCGDPRGYRGGDPVTGQPDDDIARRLSISTQSPAPWEREAAPAALPSGWQEVPAVTLGACEGRAVRWTGDPQPWGQSIIQVERAVTADHVWLHIAELIGRECGNEQLIAKALRGFSVSAQLTVSDLTGFRAVLSRLIQDLEAGR